MARPKTNAERMRPLFKPGKNVSATAKAENPEVSRFLKRLAKFEKISREHRVKIG